MCIFLAEAGIDQRAKQPACCAADSHAAQQRRKPSGADDRADAWKRQHGDKAGSGRRSRADRDPTAAPSNLPLVAVSRLAPCFRSGTTLQAFPGRHQVSELFEMRLVSRGAMPAASSPMTTRFPSTYES
jgi:hypothetical protein